MNFRKPVFVGDLVSVHAKLVRVGKTSITVHLEAWVVRRKEMHSILVTDGNFTYVAIDDQGHPQAIAQGTREPRDRIRPASIPQCRVTDMLCVTPRYAIIAPDLPQRYRIQEQLGTMSDTYIIEVSSQAAGIVVRNPEGYRFFAACPRFNRHGRPAVSQRPRGRAGGQSVSQTLV